jgi:hypothetical protein
MDGADAISFLVLIFTEIVVFIQFGFRFICPDIADYRPDGSPRTLAEVREGERGRENESESESGRECVIIYENI